MLIPVVLIFFALLIPTIVFAAESEAVVDFDQWLAEFKSEAINSGISSSLLDKAFAGVKPREKIIKSDRKQPEFTRTLDTYLANAINEVRIKKGKKLLRKYWKLFDRTDADFQVQSRILVALWGVETDFGRNMGSESVFQALATLAYDSRRGAYFRRELLDALRLVDQRSVPLERMKGSWAGAVGQVQFMPSVLLTYGVDFDGSGDIDIWTSEYDALASAANYLTQRGWQKGWTWGREVTLPTALDTNLYGLDVEKSLLDWQKIGVRGVGGADLPNVDIMASLIRPDGDSGRAFLVYDNYRKLLVWNRSHKFAIAVGLLADQIGQP
ncbi:MAG TPA: lytic murein transglycosylase [Geopsychrobacteraceae bacterium]|nr:lytic murein transglycosylase [Geopsychrobacteraceae bacterium]